MSDILSESVLSLVEAARVTPPARGGKRCHVSTILRWVLTGARGPAGELVRLEAVRLGSRWLTSREALQRFSERLTPVLDGDRAPAPRTPTQRRRAAQRAERELERAGI
jgi:hypothetical protein